MTRLGWRARILATVTLGLLGLSVSSCDLSTREAHATASPSAPGVSVARPVVARATEWDEFTGHSAAVETVEIRARVGGHLQKVGFTHGALVKKGDVLFVLDARPYQAELARASGELARAAATTDLAQREAKRAQVLFDSHTIAEREFDTQSNALLQVNAASRIASASLTAAQLNIEYATLRAPISGRIGRALVTPGNLVAPGGPPMATIVSVDPIHVYVDVDEAHALRYRSQLGAGAKLAAHVGFADEDGYPHEGAIDFIDTQVDEATGTAKARAVIANPDGRLSPGLFARMRLPAGAEHDALLVTDRAIGTDQSRKFVYVVGPDGTVSPRTVKLGPLHDGLRVVRDGVRDGDRVVVNGLQRVRPGAAVNAKDVPMKESDRTAPATGATP